jgi:hypothetical protein
MKIEAIRNLEEEQLGHGTMKRQDTPYPVEPEHHKLLNAKANKAKPRNDFFKAFHIDMAEAEAAGEASHSKTPSHTNGRHVKFEDERHVKFMDLEEPK